MQKVSYMGDGLTTEFTFNFPYFENTNIVVTKNNTTATGYSIVGTSAGQDADIPYTGGKVIFETAPTILDTITIARSLPLTRIVDYQPTELIEPTTLNQDLNYLMEVIKDRKDELNALCAQYADIADKESTTILLARISAIHDEIVAISAQITALGDISTLRSSVATNTENITTNTTNITNLKDAANFTTTGKNTIAHMTMPSNRYNDLTLDVSGTTYTAPADGYVYLCKVATASAQYIRIASETNSMATECIALSNGNWCRCWLPVSKSSTYTVHYNTAGDTKCFRFIYANGAQ